MRSHFSRTARILDRQRIDLVPPRHRAQQHHRNRTRQIQQRIRVEIGRHHDNSVDAPSHGANRRLDSVTIGIGARDQQMETMLLRGVVHTANYFGEKFAVKIGEQHAERLRLAGDETARAAVRDVSHPAGNFANQTPSFVADGAAAVENSGDGSDGHVRFTGDILDRDHSPRRCRPELDQCGIERARRRLLSFWPIFARNAFNM